VSRTGKLFVILTVFLPLGACARWPHLAGGPIEVGEEPVLVRFEQPVSPVGPEWELCLEFDPPGGSQRAHRIRAVLLDVAGRRYPFVRTSLDRKGEAVVCFVGHLEAAYESPVAFGAIELRSREAVRLRAIRGGTRDTSRTKRRP
jgi:hypothetical protein